jgi:hypothetical protein
MQNKEKQMAHNGLNGLTQETIEEAAEKYVDSFEYGIAHPRRVCKNAFINGAKYQGERMYSEEDLEVAYFEGKEGLYSFNDCLEQFKKK